MIKRQLELGLGAGNEADRVASPWRHRRYRPRAAVRARWWFDRMRELVDQAVDWEPKEPDAPAKPASDQQEMAV